MRGTELLTSTMDWSDLPHDVLEHLTSFLSLRDYHRFSAVCRNWYLVAKQTRHRPRQLPWLVLGEDDASHKRKFFSLEEKQHYLIDIPELQGHCLCGSSYGWLFTLDIKLNFRLLNPFTKICYDMPPLPPYADDLDITQYVKVAQSKEEFTFEDMQVYLVAKAILDRDPSSNLDFKVLILYGERRWLAFWKPGDSAWTVIPGVRILIDDIIFFKDNFYAVGLTMRHNEIYVVNVDSDPNIQRVEPKVPVHDSFAYLLDYMGQLLLVQRWRKIMNKGLLLITKRIIVNKIDLEAGEYSKYKPIDGHAVFMGANSCVTVDPNEYPACKKNALYMTDMPQYLTDEFGCKDLWVYDMAERSFSKYYDTNPYIPYKASPIWLVPKLQ